MPGAELKSDYWVSEYISPWDVYQHGITRIHFWKRTAYQEASIVETGLYGKALVLDGKWQSCTGDEFLYHEPLVHPACVRHGSPRTALVLGGGEGATVRELLRWTTIQRVTMVDIDAEVVDACREHLPEMHQGAFDDPRTDLVIGDALDYIAEPAHTPPGGWDVIISDLSDPILDGPSYNLFTREFFASLKGILAARGILVVQAGSLAPGEARLHAGLSRTLRDVFDHASSYASFVPTYAAPWSYVLCHPDPWDRMSDPAAVDALLADRTTGGFRVFDGRTMLGLFQIPLFARELIDREQTVFTRENPPRFFGAGIADQPR